VEDTKVKIRKFLSNFIRRVEVQDDDDIFALGFVNSLFAMQLVMFIEKEFQVRINNKDLNLNNFRSINKIACLVVGKND
jgi:methoxymalonate biosynthesis acyl carrier protein